LITPGTLSIADFLEDHLLGRLRIDPAQINRRQRIDDEIPDLGVFIQLLRGLQIDLLEVVLNFFNHFDHAPQAQIASARIKLGANVVLCAITVARRLLDRFFHRLDHDRLVDQLLIGDRGGDRQQFGTVGGNRTGHRLLPSYLESVCPELVEGLFSLQRSVRSEERTVLRQAQDRRVIVVILR
jgi:hypothetical protein